MADDKPLNEDVVLKDETPAEETKVEEATADESAPEEPAQQEAPDEAPEEAPAEPEPEETPAAPSRREQLRVQDLLKKYGPPKQEPSKANSPDFRNQIEADEEVYKTLEETTQRFGQTQYNQGLEQAKYYKWETLLQIDAPTVEGKFPQLDRKSPDFHPALADAMNNKYLRFVGYDAETGTVRNPEIRYSDFVEAEMEFADEVASQRVQRTTENIAKQAAQTGLRPDGSQANRLNLNKTPEDMTDQELNAYIGAALPRDARGRFLSR